jgi:4a-hydroxytetrahydrobiopterin dehydratase
MHQVQKLIQSEIDEQLLALNQLTKDKWQLLDGRLYKQFSFSDFTRAMSFMQAAAIVAESMDHHPEWCNIYNRLDVSLVTHSVQGLSALDFELARKLEQIPL